VGPTWNGLECFKEEITKGSFRGLRYAVLGHEDLWGLRLTRVVVSRIWAIWWKDVCNVGYAVRNAGWAATSGRLVRFPSVNMRSPVLLRVVL